MRSLKDKRDTIKSQIMVEAEKTTEEVAEVVSTDTLDTENTIVEVPEEQWKSDAKKGAKSMPPDDPDSCGQTCGVPPRGVF